MTDQYSVEIFTRGSYAVPVATFGQAVLSELTGGDVLNDVSSGSWAVKRDAVGVSAIQADRIAQLSLRGVPAWWMVLEPPTDCSVSQFEADKVVTATGPSLAAVLAELVVTPASGSDVLPAPTNRIFDFTNRDYDISGWDAAQSFGAQGSALYPSGWTDPLTELVGPQSASATDADPGIWFLASPDEGEDDALVVPSTVSEVLVEIAFDNGGQVFLGGERLQVSGATQTVSRVVKITDGWHRIGAAIFNSADEIGMEDNNPTNALITVWEWLDSQHRGALLCRTTGNWKTLDLGSTYPSLNAGQILLHVLADNATLGAGTDITPTFTASTDSSGTAWPAIVTSAVVSSSVLQLARELVANFYLDYRLRIDPVDGLLLDAWVSGGRAVDTAINLHEATDSSNPQSGNLAKLVRRGARKVSDTLVASWLNGFRYVVDASPTGVRKVVGVALGSATSAEIVDQQAAALIALYRAERAVIDAKPLLHINSPSGEYPLLGFIPGDTLLVPDGAGTARERVLEMDWVLQTSGVLDWTYRLKDPLAEGQERLINQLSNTQQQLSRGSVGGTAGVSAGVETATDRQYAPPPLAKHVFDLRTEGETAPHPIERTGKLVKGRATRYDSSDSEINTSATTMVDVLAPGGSFSILILGGATSGITLLGDTIDAVTGTSPVVTLTTSGTTCSGVVTRVVVELYVA